MVALAPVIPKTDECNNNNDANNANHADKTNNAKNANKINKATRSKNRSGISITGDADDAMKSSESDWASMGISSAQQTPVILAMPIPLVTHVIPI